MPKKNEIFEFFLDVIIASIAVLAIRELLQDDSSRVVSDQGKKILEDDESMDRIEKIILSSKNEDESITNDVLIDLD